VVREGITFHRRGIEAVLPHLIAAGLEPVLRTIREPASYPGMVEAVPQAYLVVRRPSAGA
jgi:hypothetical protein